MFHFFKKKQKSYEMAATADGKVIPMTDASDPVFSSCALGGGVVIRPTGTVVVAPADGRVTATMEGSNHAIGMELEGGLEILIHIGVDTVSLKGEGFTALWTPRREKRWWPSGSNRKVTEIPLCCAGKHSVEFPAVFSMESIDFKNAFSYYDIDNKEERGCRNW